MALSLATRKSLATFDAYHREPVAEMTLWPELEEVARASAVRVTTDRKGKKHPEFAIVRLRDRSQRRGTDIPYSLEFWNKVARALIVTGFLEAVSKETSPGRYELLLQLRAPSSPRRLFSKNASSTRTAEEIERFGIVSSSPTTVLSPAPSSPSSPAPPPPSPPPPPASAQDMWPPLCPLAPAAPRLVSAPIQVPPPAVLCPAPAAPVLARLPYNPVLYSLNKTKDIWVPASAPLLSSTPSLKDECTICYVDDRVCTAICVPCGHQSSCSSCARDLKAAGHLDCAICREPLAGWFLKDECVTLSV